MSFVIVLPQLLGEEIVWLYIKINVYQEKEETLVMSSQSTSESKNSFIWLQLESWSPQSTSEMLIPFG